MTTRNNHTEWVKLPATLDSPGYKKPSDEFTFTFATPKKYLDPYIQDMQAKLGTSGVLFYVPCTGDQVDALLKDAPDVPGIGNPEPEVIACPPITLRELAELLNRDERTVQLLEEKGVVVRITRGLYDRDKTIAGIWKALKEAESGATDAYSEERTKAMRLKRQERELQYLERAGKLGNVEAIQTVIEKAKAAEKQQVLFMPKQLAPRLDGDPAVNEAILDEWAYSFLKGQTKINIIDAAKAAAPDPDKMPEMKKRKKKTKKKKK